MDNPISQPQPKPKRRWLVAIIFIVISIVLGNLWFAVVFSVADFGGGSLISPLAAWALLFVIIGVFVGSAVWWHNIIHRSETLTRQKKITSVSWRLGALILFVVAFFVAQNFYTDVRVWLLDRQFTAQDDCTEELVKK